MPPSGSNRDFNVMPKLKEEGPLDLLDFQKPTRKRRRRSTMLRQVTPLFIVVFLLAHQVCGFNTSYRLNGQNARPNVEHAPAVLAERRRTARSTRLSLGRPRLPSRASEKQLQLSLFDKAEDASEKPQQLEPKVYPQRWTQLAYLSLLALLSDWICFSVAASPDSFEHAYPGASAANLIDIFLFTNVASCFLVTDVVARFGLDLSIKGSAGLMTLGCLLRSGLPDLSWLPDNLGTSIVNAADNLLPDGAGEGLVDMIPDAVVDMVDPSTLTEASRTAGLEPYPLLVLGTVLVGFAQVSSCSVPVILVESSSHVSFAAILPMHATHVECDLVCL